MAEPRRVNRHAWWKALRGSNLPPRARLLAFVLSTWMAADGTKCYPGQDAIAAACGWTDPTTVRRATTELEDAGYIQVVRYGGIRAPGRSQKTHRYWPTVPTDQSGSPARLETGDQSGSGARLVDAETDDQSGSPAREDSTTSPAPEHDWSPGPVRQNGRTSPANQHDQSGSPARQGFQGRELPSLNNPPPARAREDDFPPPPDELAAGTKGEDQLLDHLTRKLALDIRRPNDDLRRALAARLADGWTVTQLAKRIDQDRPEQIKSPRNWLTEQLAGLAAVESPRCVKERADAKAAALQAEWDERERRLAESSDRMADARALVDALDPDQRAELEAKALADHPNPRLVPSNTLMLEVADLARQDR